MPVPWRALNIAAAKTVNIAPAPCELIAVTVNTASAGTTLTVFDGGGSLTTTNMTKLATIDTGTLNTYVFGCVCENGLTVTTSGTADVTIVYAAYRSWQEFDGIYGQGSAE